MGGELILVRMELIAMKHTETNSKSLRLTSKQLAVLCRLSQAGSSGITASDLHATLPEGSMVLTHVHRILRDFRTEGLAEDPNRVDGIRMPRPGGRSWAVTPEGNKVLMDHMRDMGVLNYTNEGH